MPGRTKPYHASPKPTRPCQSAPSLALPCRACRAAPDGDGDNAQEHRAQGNPRGRAFPRGHRRVVQSRVGAEMEATSGPTRESRTRRQADKCQITEGKSLGFATQQRSQGPSRVGRMPLHTGQRHPNTGSDRTQPPRHRGAEARQVSATRPRPPSHRNAGDRICRQDSPALPVRGSPR